MSRKKYRYKKETAQNDGVTVIDENHDDVPEALEVDGHREDFVEVKELDETEPRPKGYEEITEEETASRVEGDAASTSDTHTTEDTTYVDSRPAPLPIGGSEETHSDTTVDVRPSEGGEEHSGSSVETHENPQSEGNHETHTETHEGSPVSNDQTDSHVAGNTDSHVDEHTNEVDNRPAEHPYEADTRPPAQPIEPDIRPPAHTLEPDVRPDSSVETHTETHENPQGADAHDNAHTTDDQAGTYTEGNTYGLDVRPGSEEGRREESPTDLQPTQPEGAVAGSVTEGGQPSTGVTQPAPEAHTETTHEADPLVPDVRPPAQPLEPDIRPAPSHDEHSADTASSEIASNAQEPPAVVSPDSTASQPQPPVGTPEDHHDTVVSPAAPNGEGVGSSEQQPPSVSAGTHEENHVDTQPTGEVSPSAPVVGTPAGQVDPAPANPSTTVGSEPAVPGSTGNTESHDDVMRPYTPPAVEQPANQAGSEPPAVPPSAPSDTVTVESATGPAPGEVIVPPGNHDGGVGVNPTPDTSHVDTPSAATEHHAPEEAPQERSLEGLLPEDMNVVEFAKSIRHRMEEYCRLMGPAVMQTEQTLVRNQLELYSIFMAVLYVSDVAKFEAGIKQIFVVMNANKAMCFDYSARFRGITDIPPTRMNEDEVETFTALIDLFCRLVSATDLYEIGRTYNFNTLQRHLTDQFVLSRFLGFVRRIVGAA